jgi:hypothetical protein
MFTHLLLCTHGTPGARLAERFFFERLWPGFPDAEATVLTVVNQDWSVMVGDDWLNSSATRNAFRSHVDRQLAEEIEADWQRIRTDYAEASRCAFKRIFGPVEATFVEVARNLFCDGIVIGPYQKKQGRGFKDRLQNKVLHPLLTVPLLVAPGDSHGKDI